MPIGSVRATLTMSVPRLNRSTPRTALSNAAMNMSAFGDEVYSLTAACRRLVAAVAEQEGGIRSTLVDRDGTPDCCGLAVEAVAGVARIASMTTADTRCAVRSAIPAGVRSNRVAPVAFASLIRLTTTLSA